MKNIQQITNDIKNCISEKYLWCSLSFLGKSLEDIKKINIQYKDVFIDITKEILEDTSIRLIWDEYDLDKINDPNEVNIPPKLHHIINNSNSAEELPVFLNYWKNQVPANKETGFSYTIYFEKQI